MPYMCKLQNLLSILDSRFHFHCHNHPNPTIYTLHLQTRHDDVCIKPLTTRDVGSDNRSMLDLFSQACKPANVNSTVRVRSNARFPLMSRLREKKSLPGGFLRRVFPSFLRCSPAAASLRCPSKRKVRHFHGTLLSLSRRTSFVRVLLHVLQNVFYVEKKAYIESLGL